MNTLLPEPQYVISLEEIIWGGTLVAITMSMHGIGMTAVLRANISLKNWIGTKKGILSGLFLIIFASWMIMLVHLTEVMVWAAFFSWKSAFSNYSLAYYFSLNEFTTLGSNYNLPLHWRLLEGLTATAGLLTFAWSTGILLSLAQEFQEQRMQSLRQRQAKRSSKPAPNHDPNNPDAG